MYSFLETPKAVTHILNEAYKKAELSRRNSYLTVGGGIASV